MSGRRHRRPRFRSVWRGVVMLLLAGYVSVACAPADVRPAPDSAADEAPSSEPAPDPFACVPASVRALDADVQVTARADGGDGEVVLLEWHARDAAPLRLAADFHPVLIRLADGACESLLPEQSDAFRLDALVSEPVLAELMRENAEWKAARVGGAEAYRRLLEEAYSAPLVACPSRSDEAGPCIDPDRARALVSLGISVDPTR